MTDSAQQILRMEGITKRYGGVLALSNVQFDLNRGEVHALVGENGAGKSTLIKVLGGIVPRDGGTIIYDGAAVDFSRPIDAMNAGIAIIHQELSNLPSMSVIENLFTGRVRSRFGLMNWRKLERMAKEALQPVRLNVDVYTPVRELSISQRQLIEIARALNANAKLIIMDEPNSSLSEAETEILFDVIADLKANDIAIIYVSHKIDEVLRISDRITVLRDGHYVGTIPTHEATEQRVITMMVGRDLDRSVVTQDDHIGETLLEVRGLSGKRFKNVSFTIRRGEIVAFSGLIGAGRSDVARAIFGAEHYDAGEVIFKGRRVRFGSPASAIKHGIAMVQEDRKNLSLFMKMAIAHNISMAELPFMNRLKLINPAGERKLAQQQVKALDIRLASLDHPVSSLSGGNQQKTVLGRWLATNPELLILDEPTHGVDVGAKAEIYELMRRLAKEGMGILLISSELPEVLALAHRIVVMCEGRVTGILPRAEATQELIMEYATGLRDDFAQTPASAQEAV